MRKFLIASVVALAASMPFGISTASADVIFRIDNGRHHERTAHRRHHHESRHHHRHWRDHHRRHGRHGRDCYTQRVVHHHHGRAIVRMERICR